MAESKTYRWLPRNLLMWAIGFSVLLLGLMLFGWFALDAHIRALFTIPQILTLLFFAGFMITGMMSMGLSRVIADEEGVWFRNGLRIHRASWTEVAEVRYRHGDPWAYLVFGDGSEDAPKKMLMGVQTTDGARAVEAVATLRELHAAARDRAKGHQQPEG